MATQSAKCEYCDKTVDHILPLSRFNLQDNKEFKRAVHYTNLQPLWLDQNLSKGNR